MIIVVDPEKKTRLPFSRGILTRSITSAGVDVGIAYSVATEIVKTFSEQGRKIVTKDEIRELTYHRLLERGLKEEARKYLFWRKIKKLKFPMILLIGGTTGVGKSTISTELAFRLGIRTTIGTDTIREVMRKIIARELLPALHTSSFMASNVINKIPRGVSPLIFGFETQVRHVAVGVNAVIERAYTEGFNTVVEGIHLVPGYISLNDRSFMYVVAVKSRKSLEARFYERERYSLRPADYYIQNLDAIMEIQEFILEHAKEHDIPVVENIELEDTVDKIMSDLMERVAERMKERGIEI
ncbi:2-phosphoglycerate kinase [Thermococcus sp.]